MADLRKSLPKFTEMIRNMLTITDLIITGLNFILLKLKNESIFSMYFYENK